MWKYFVGECKRKVVVQKRPRTNSSKQPWSFKAFAKTAWYFIFSSNSAVLSLSLSADSIFKPCGHFNRSRWLRSQLPTRLVLHCLQCLLISAASAKFPGKLICYLHVFSFLWNIDHHYTLLGYLAFVQNNKQQLKCFMQAFCCFISRNFDMFVWKQLLLSHHVHIFMMVTKSCIC